MVTAAAPSTEFVADRLNYFGLVADRPQKVATRGGENFVRQRSI